MAGKASKGDVYATALADARREGRWNDKINTPLASGLPWSELVRKYAKHNPSRSLTADTARAEQLAYTSLASAAENAQADQAFAHDIGYQSFPEAGPFRNNEYQRPPITQWSQREDLRAANDSLLSSINQSSAGSEEANSARIVSSLCYYALNEPESSLEQLNLANTDLSQADDSHDFHLRVIARCIAGRSYEILGDLRQAETSYLDAGRAVDANRSLLSNKNVTLSHWLEDALYRLALMSAHDGDTPNSLAAHRAFHSLTSSKSASASPFKRSAFYRSYLFLLRDTYKAKTWTPIPGSTLNNGHTGGSAAVNRTAWQNELNQVQDSYLKLIEQTTSFPRAGLLNQPMLDFVDGVYESWLAGGRRPEDASAAIEIHFRAIERTFHSQRILRHLIHLQAAIGDFDDAERSLRLYDRLFTKAKQTDARAVAKEVLDFYERRGETIEGGKGANQPDFDSDEQYVRTVAFGVRLLCRQKREVEFAVELADRLESYAKEDESLLSVIEFARGVARATLSEIMADADHRSKDQQKALGHLRRALELDPEDPDKLYLLAHLQTEMRDVPGATTTIRKAVQINSERPELWHLLVLLTSATRDYEGALKIADLALDASDVDGVSVRSGAPEGGAGGDFATPDETPAETPSLSDGPTLGGGEAGTGGIGSVVGTGTLLQDQQSAAYSHLPPPIGTQHRPHADDIDNGGHSLNNGSSAPNGIKSGGTTSGGGITSQALKNHLGQAASSNAQAQPRTSTSTVRPAHDETPIPPLDAEALDAELQLRMTRNALVEIIEGPEAALQDQQELFSLFARISPRLASTSSALAATSGSAAVHGGDAATLNAETRHAGTEKSHLGEKDGVIQRSASRAGGTTSKMNRVLSPTQPHQAGDDNDKDLQSRHRHHGHGKNSLPIERAHAARARALLVKLWLLSAGTFRRWGKVEEGRAAIEAAESIDPEMPGVWIQLALYDLAVGDKHAASTALTKALALSPVDQLAMTELGKLHLAEGEYALAEAALEEATQGRGWGNGAAWRALGAVCAKTERVGRARRCLEYALSLEQTRPVRPLEEAVPRIL